MRAPFADQRRRNVEGRFRWSGLYGRLEHFLDGECSSFAQTCVYSIEFTSKQLLHFVDGRLLSRKAHGRGFEILQTRQFDLFGYFDSTITFTSTEGVLLLDTGHLIVILELFVSEKSSSGHWAWIDHVFILVDVVLPVDTVCAAALVRSHSNPVGVGLVGAETPQFDISFVDLPVLFRGVDWRRTNRGGGRGR